MWQVYLADTIVAIHTAFVGFVVIGQVLILVGLARHWAWVRHFGFRLVHLAAISVVAVEAVFGFVCPLTTWERQLRADAGQFAHEGSFVGRLCDTVLFYELPDWIFRIGHVSFGVLVLATFLLAPPRRRRAPGPGVET